MRDLVAGERAPMFGEQTFALVGDGGNRSTLALLALGSDRRGSPAFAPLDGLSREMRPAARFEDAGRLRVSPDDLPPEVDRILLIAFERTNGRLGGRLEVAVGDLRFAVDLRDRPDAAVTLVECYRHRGGWRIAANGQGYAQGLSAIAAAHGIDQGWVDRLVPQPGAGPAGGDRPAGRTGTSSGSGVAVDDHHVLTNAHVVEDAAAVVVHASGRPLDGAVVFSDPRNDLALVRVEAALPAVAGFRSEIGLHLGEDVVALGFPLQGLLGTGPQASAGNVSALCSLGNDSSVFQFTAPIASGNSGGPILDMTGRLIGLVSSSLDLDRIRRSGASAENVNFGVKAAMILSFLDAFGIEPRMTHEAAAIGRAAVVRSMRGAICRIACE